MTQPTNSDVVDVLNDLIENAKDGQYGFLKCAERVKSLQLRETLAKRAAGCEQAVAELQSLVVQYGGQPAEYGTMAGALHRGWVTVKDVLTMDSDHAVLEECERGEDTALARYRRALKAELPADVREVIMRQMAGTQTNHDQVKMLRDTTHT
ncbi:MAG TPA: PA2169 family four-helix-bundle protein [Rubrivivax sp.]|nr:PA2169 family four-helix-bundle protein [Rubrivivax sp.]